MDQSRGEGPTAGGPDSGNKPRVAHELRYDGPITLDEDDFDDDTRNPGSARRTVVAFFAVSFVVVVLLAVALFLKEDSRAPDVTTLVADAPPPAEPGAWQGAAEPGATEAGTAPPPAADDPQAWRPVPAEGAGQAERPAPEQAAAASVAERPAPREAAHYVEPPAAPSAPAETTPRPSDLARAGSLAEAARRSRRLALAAPAGSWTLQVLFACEPSNVRRAVDRAGGEELMIFAVTRGGRDCFRLAWGIYGDREAAARAAGRVPAYFREASRPQPVVLAKAAGL